LIKDTMSSSAAIHIVSPPEFDLGTAQTPGSERREAIAPALGIASAIWGGLFEVEPGARTGIHHHGEQETIAYVLSGVCEIRWGARGEFAAQAKGCRAQHRDAYRRQRSERHVAVSPDVVPDSRTTAGRKPEFPADQANMEPSWTSKTPMPRQMNSLRLRLLAAR
jgi:hypothetical protein